MNRTLSSEPDDLFYLPVSILIFFRRNSGIFLFLFKDCLVTSGGMPFQNTPELMTFFSTYIADGDPEADESAARVYIAAVSPERLDRLIAQAKQVLTSVGFSLEELGTASNRWFGEESEARSWLERLVAALESAHGAASMSVKDCNGAPLLEGDSVLVIKDLKVKGGSSDLKRGTVIRKIHLVGDPEVVECRVDGSTLVLKTIFLKKS